MSDIKKIIGNRIRNLRIERNWSQEELAHRANLHSSFMGAVERGGKSASIETLEKIAFAFDITLEELFKFIQPSIENKDYSTLSLLMNKLSTLTVEEQKNVLQLLDILLVMINRNK